MKEIKKRSDCPISCSLDVWGDKWSLLIIRDLLKDKECTYGDFMKSPERIATNILASRLLVLEENKIIVKMEHPDSKAKVLYKLTEKGIDLLPIIVEINLWAEKYYSIPEEQKRDIKGGEERQGRLYKSNNKQVDEQRIERINAVKSMTLRRLYRF